jgi:hypothetical protein
MHFGERRWGVVDWIDLIQDSDQCRAVLKAVMNFRVPQNPGKFLSSYKIGGFPIRAQLHVVNFVNCMQGRPNELYFYRKNFYRNTLYVMSGVITLKHGLRSTSVKLIYIYCNASENRPMGQKHV